MLDHELARDVSGADVARANVKVSLWAVVEFCGLLVLGALFQVVDWVKEPKTQALGVVVTFALFFLLRWKSTRADLELRKDFDRRITAREFGRSARPVAFPTEPTGYAVEFDCVSGLSRLG